MKIVVYSLVLIWFEMLGYAYSFPPFSIKPIDIMCYCQNEKSKNAAYQAFTKTKEDRDKKMPLLEYQDPDITEGVFTLSREEIYNTLGYWNFKAAEFSPAPYRAKISVPDNPQEVRLNPWLILWKTFGKRVQCSALTIIGNEVHQTVEAIHTTECDFQDTDPIKCNIRVEVLGRFSCPECGKTFSHRNTLYVHKKELHKPNIQYGAFNENENYDVPTPSTHTLKRKKSEDGVNVDIEGISLAPPSSKLFKGNLEIDSDAAGPSHVGSLPSRSTSSNRDLHVHPNLRSHPHEAIGNPSHPYVIMQGPLDAPETVHGSPYPRFTMPAVSNPFLDLQNQLNEHWAMHNLLYPPLTITTMQNPFQAMQTPLYSLLQSPQHLQQLSQQLGFYQWAYQHPSNPHQTMQGSSHQRQPKHLWQPQNQ